MSVFQLEARALKGLGRDFPWLTLSASARNYTVKPLPCIADYNFYTEVL